MASDGIDLTQVRAVTSGPAANIYIRLAGREPDGTVSQSEYLSLQQQVVHILKQFFDTNALYTLGAAKWPVFDKIYTHPADLGDPNSGRRTSAFIGQDSGDEFFMKRIAILRETLTPERLKLLAQIREKLLPTLHR